MLFPFQLTIHSEVEWKYSFIYSSIISSPAYLSEFILSYFKPVIKTLGVDPHCCEYLFVERHYLTNPSRLLKLNSGTGFRVVSELLGWVVSSRLRLAVFAWGLAGVAAGRGVCWGHQGMNGWYECKIEWTFFVRMHFISISSYYFCLFICLLPLYIFCIRMFILFFSLFMVMCKWGLQVLTFDSCILILISWPLYSLFSLLYVKFW